METKKKIFLWTGRCEGVSYLLLLGVAMPLKYIWHMPEAVQIVGMAHGVLFLAYVGLVLFWSSTFRWSPVFTMLGLLASVLPFGTFVFERYAFEKA